MAEPVSRTVGLAIYACGFVGKMQMYQENLSGFSSLTLIFHSTVAAMSYDGFWCSPHE